MEKPIVLSRIGVRVASDSDLFTRAAESDPVAFGELYRRYHDRIHGYCLARVMDPQTAEDAAQEVFLRVLQTDPAGVENPRAWLYGVARHVSADCLRRRIRLAETGPADEGSPAWLRLTAADTADTVMGREAARNIFIALRRLNPRYRTALMLRELHGQTSAEIAEALNTTIGAVDTLVSRARDAFGRTYASVSGLPPACATTVELIYRRIGSGIDDGELQRIKAHVKHCPKCRTEYGRTTDRHGLSALLPFLVPSRAFGSIPQAVLSNPAAVHLVERCSEMDAIQHMMMRVGAIVVTAALAITGVGAAQIPSGNGAASVRAPISAPARAERIVAPILSQPAAFESSAAMPLGGLTLSLTQAPPAESLTTSTTVLSGSGPAAVAP